MLCNMCNERDAILLVQQVSFAGKKEIHLCPLCAKERGIDVDKSNVGESMNKLIDSVVLPKRGCYACGKTFEDIQTSGLLGCPECYISFHKEIKSILDQKGFDSPYMGLMPKKLDHFRSILTDRIAIQKKLEASVADEDFEKAALYRDFLKTMERSAISTVDTQGDLFGE